MSDELDTNINNYTNDELLEIIGFSKSDLPTKQEVVNNFNKLANKYITDKNIPIGNFFIQARNKIINNVELTEDTDKTPVQAEYWLENQFLRQDNQVQTDKITKRANKVQLFNKESHPIMHREQLGVNNAIALDIAQDSLNPTLRQLTTKFITIDSQYRENIIPYSPDPNSNTSSTNFLCTLTEKLKNVITIKLNSIFIPQSWYVFDQYLNNTCFLVYYDSSNNFTEDTSNVLIRINDGNYKASNLITHISEQLNKNPDLSGLDISNIPHINNQIVQFTNINKKMYFKIVFYSETNKISCYDNLTCINKMKYDQNLGYYLGFRIKKEHITNLTNNKHPDLAIILGPSGSAISNIQQADVPVDIIGPQYFTLLIDDYNYNHNNNGGITIQKKGNHTSLPLYFNKLAHHDISCIDQKNNIHTYLPTHPRKLTQNKLYAINEIILNNKEPSNTHTRNSSHNNSNIFAHIPITTTTESMQNSSIAHINLDKQSHSERKYFGPVSIEKIRVCLYDDRGNIVNLHGHNWSFTLIADELYQY